jgi:hypothetical protein
MKEQGGLVGEKAEYPARKSGDEWLGFFTEPARKRYMGKGGEHGNCEAI